MAARLSRLTRASPSTTKIGVSIASNVSPPLPRRFEDGFLQARLLLVHPLRFRDVEGESFEISDLVCGGPHDLSRDLHPDRLSLLVLQPPLDRFSRFGRVEELPDGFVALPGIEVEVGRRVLADELLRGVAKNLCELGIDGQDPSVFLDLIDAYRGEVEDVAVLLFRLHQGPFRRLLLRHVARERHAPPHLSAGQVNGGDLDIRDVAVLAHVPRRRERLRYSATGATGWRLRSSGGHRSETRIEENPRANIRNARSRLR